MAPGCIFQIFLRVTIQNQIRISQRVIIDEAIQLRPLRHGHIQSILNPGAVNGNFSPILESQLHTPGIHVKLAGSFIVLHNRVLQTLIVWLRSMTRYRSFTPSTGAFILKPEENEKSEPFSNRKQVRIFLVWWELVDSNHRSIKQQIYSLSPLATRESSHILFCVCRVTRQRMLL